jgi:hypothetical protein
MVTDAVTEPSKVETARPYGVRLALTLLVLALYGFGQRIPLPMVSPALREVSPTLAARTSVLALGINPLWTGFFLVELFAVAASAGRRLRRSGDAGRARLNRAALMTSLALAALQAAGVAIALENMVGPEGGSVVLTPGVGFSMLTILTLTAATAALYAAGQFLSAWGIGNGFALLMIVNVAGRIANALPGAPREIEDVPAVGFGLLAAAGLAAVAFRLIRKSEDQWMPAFPQSLLPALAVPWLWALVGLLSMPRAAELVLASVLILLLSWLGFHLLSSRPRLEASLSEPDDVLDGIAQALRRQAVPAAVLLTLGTVALLAGQEYWPSRITFAFAFPQIVMVLAIGFDLWDQYRFERRHGRWARLAQFDDVHFSYRLEERLQEEEIAALARGHHLRSLFFFFGAIYKIDMLVPEEQLGRARQVMAEVEMAREIKTF